MLQSFQWIDMYQVTLWEKVFYYQTMTCGLNSTCTHSQSSAQCLLANAFTLARKSCTPSPIKVQVAYVWTPLYNSNHYMHSHKIYILPSYDHLSQKF
jgi:hypothetical protein